jgi:uncharacterized protein (DUF362 family)
MNKPTGLISRRDFLKVSATGASLGLTGYPALTMAMSDWDLAVVSGAPAAATRRAIEVLGGMGRFVKKGQRVVIKPNMSFAKEPDAATTTHPAVVAAVAQACIDAGARSILVFDHTLHRPELCLEKTGIREACRNLPGVVVSAVKDKRFFREVRVPQGVVLDRVEILEDLLEDPVLINVPVAKSHSTTIVSLGLKNSMGLIWNRWSFHIQFNIHEGLVDLATVIRPQLTIIDASRALVTGGPGGPGEVRRTNQIIAGVDPVAVDAYGVGIAPWFGRNFTPGQMEFLTLARRRRLGRMDLKELKIFQGAV